MLRSCDFTDTDDDLDIIVVFNNMQDLVAVDATPGRYVLFHARVCAEHVHKVAIVVLGDSILRTDRLLFVAIFNVRQ